MSSEAAFAFTAATLRGEDLTTKVGSLPKRACGVKGLQTGIALLDVDPTDLIGPTRQQRMRELLAYGAATAGELAKFSGTTVALVPILLKADVDRGRVRQWRERGHDVFDLHPDYLERECEPLVRDARHQRMA